MSDLIKLAETVAESLYGDGQKRVPAVIDALRYEIERLTADYCEAREEVTAFSQLYNESLERTAKLEAYIDHLNGECPTNCKNCGE